MWPLLTSAFLFNSVHSQPGLRGLPQGVPVLPREGCSQHANTAQSCGVRPGVRAAVRRVAFVVDSI